MNADEEFQNLFMAAFPAEPRPIKFFLETNEDWSDLDIPQELERRIAGRLWTQVTLMDWRMTGTAPVVARRYLVPATFLYYVPSIIVGTYRELEFIEFALEGIIPDNKYHVPRGNWWFEFAEAVSPPQKVALSVFLSYIREAFWDRIGPANQSLLEHAEKIWSV